MQTTHSLCSTAKLRAGREACLQSLQRLDRRWGGPGMPCSATPCWWRQADGPPLWSQRKWREKPTRSEHQCHVTSSFAGSMLLETDLSRRQPVSPRKRSVAEGRAGGQAGRPMAPAPRAPCPLTGLLRMGWQGLEILKVSRGKGLAQSHPGVRPLTSLKHHRRGAALEESSEVLHCSLLSLQPTSALKRVAVNLPGEQSHCLGTATIPTHPLF